MTQLWHQKLTSAIVFQDLGKQTFEKNDLAPVHSVIHEPAADQHHHDQRLHLPSPLLTIQDYILGSYQLQNRIL